MICKNEIDGVEIYVLDFAPVADDWEKFLAYVRQFMSFHLTGKLIQIFVKAQHTEHGILFDISYTLLESAGNFVPEHEIKEGTA